MNEIRKKMLLLALRGFFLGVLVGIAIMFAEVSFWGADMPDMAYLIRHLILSGVVGLVPNAAVVMYEIEEWSIARATITHFVVTFGTLYAVAFVQGWFVPWSIGFWIMTVVCLVMYIIIWLIQYLIYKRQIRKMNEELQKWKSDQADGT